MDDEAIWAEIEANELRLWVTLRETGLWCPTCLLSTGIGLAIQRDPVEAAPTTMRRCAIDATHRIPHEAQP